jgi:hypothetical protein
MKTLLLLALIAFFIGFASCRKSGIKPTAPKIQDTLSDSALFKIQLVNVKDTLPPPSNYWIGRVEMLIKFNHTYHLAFSHGLPPYWDEDAGVPGYGSGLNVMGITIDGVAVQVDGIPYKAGVSVPLLVTGDASGQYLLRAYYVRWFPQDIHIWCKDNYLKDSVDLRKGNYHFTMDKADTNQYGKKRFSIILGPK